MRRARLARWPGLFIVLNSLILGGCVSGGLGKAPDGRTGAKFAPPTGRCYHGGGQDPKSFQSYCEALGARAPIISMQYTTLRPGDYAELRRAIDKAPKTFPQIGLQLRGGKDARPQPFTGAVARGARDEQIRALAVMLKDLKRPVFLRVGYEFNGPWNGYESKSFIAAWKHIHSLFQREGATNVAFVWNWAADAKRGAPYLDYYPGDDKVDWWALNVFGVASFDKPETRKFVAEARRRGKPVMIGESTPRGVTTLQGAKSWGLWFEPYFDLIKRYDLEAFCYINWDWPSKEKFPQWHSWGDCRIEANPYVQGRMRAELDDPRYIHTGEFGSLCGQMLDPAR